MSTHNSPLEAFSAPTQEAAQQFLRELMAKTERQSQQADREIADIPMTSLMARLAGVHDIGAGAPQKGEWQRMRKADKDLAQALFERSVADQLTALFKPQATKQPEIPVTPEMIAAAVATDKAMSSPLPDEAYYFAPIYRAMAALAPVELVSAGELAAVRERNSLQREVADLRCRLAERDASALKAIRNRV